ncbi:MAG: HD domain-containing protein [Eubacteriales bacterium]|nr:HD domain-containing protein [Eubacteriales bacterium]
MVTLQDIQKNPELNALIKAANQVLAAIGYTEHGPRHVGYVSHAAAELLRELEYPERTVELAAIAGLIHDVGNSINRVNHGITGATMIYPILRDMGMAPAEIATVISAVGNHEEQNGRPVSPVSAALIIADKSDAHRTRVRRGKFDPTDIHDRVNYSIKKNWVEVDREEKVIRFAMTMDDTSSVMEFFLIYLTRMEMCEQAAALLGCRFDIVINGVTVNNQRSVELARAAIAQASNPAQD